MMANLAAHEEKVAARTRMEEETGEKQKGRNPKPLETGSKPKDQVNFTDPDSRIMPSTEGFVQAYNAQAVVDNASHLVVAAHVSDRCNDKRELDPAIEQLGKVGKPDGMLADAGYFSKENVERCIANGTTPYIAVGREKRNQPVNEHCAVGRRLPGRRRRGCPNEAPAENAGRQSGICKPQGHRGKRRSV